MTPLIWRDNKLVIPNKLLLVSDGSVFNFNLKDNTGTITIPLYDGFVNKFNDLISTGKFYHVSNAMVHKKSKYSHQSNEYRLQAIDDTDITECNENLPSVDMPAEKFVPFARVKLLADKTAVNIRGSIKTQGNLHTISGSVSR